MSLLGGLRTKPKFSNLWSGFDGKTLIHGAQSCPNKTSARSFPLPRAGPDQEHGPCCCSASCMLIELAKTRQTITFKPVFSSFHTDFLLLSFNTTNRFHILNPSFKKAKPPSLSSHLTVTAVRRCRIQTRTPNLWAWLCLSYNILAIFIHYRDLKKDDFFSFFPRTTSGKQQTCPESCSNSQQLSPRLPPAPSHAQQGCQQLPRAAHEPKADCRFSTDLAISVPWCRLPFLAVEPRNMHET